MTPHRYIWHLVCLAGALVAGVYADIPTWILILVAVLGIVPIPWWPFGVPGRASAQGASGRTRLKL